MLRAFFVFLMLSLPAAPAHADAETVRNAIVRELREDGYTSIRMSRTLLGRLRFVAERPGAEREIVVNPRTGVVLRDYRRIWLNDGENVPGSGGGSGSSGSGSGGEEDDDDENDDEDDESDDDEADDDDDESDDDESDDEDDDDDDDDDDESDNSGPGSGN